MQLIIDREQAAAQGVTFADINSTISTNLGSAYVNDFPNRGRMQRVIVQADSIGRMNAQDILSYNVKNSRGDLVPLSSFATIKWAVGPTQIIGFNYYPSVRISGEAKPGYTSGDAIAEMERLTGQLPRGFGFEWTGQSLQEKLSGSQAPFLLGLSALVVFLCLAALYESWTIPLAVLMTVPLGICGAVLAATSRGLANDVYFTVGLITIIGLAAMDAILIIEFAKDLRAKGTPLLQATMEACHLRFRPILMTGLAFRLGRATDGDRQRRRREKPAGAWHQRDGRHDRRRGSGAPDGAGVFRRGDEVLLEGRARRRGYACIGIEVGALARHVPTQTSGADAGVVTASVIASEAKQSRATSWIASSLTRLAMTDVVIRADLSTRRPGAGRDL